MPVTVKESTENEPPPKPPPSPPLGGPCCAPLLPEVGRWIASDSSVIVRDNSIDILHRYGKTSPEAAARSIDPLITAASVSQGKHAARVLAALVDFVPLVPDAHDRLMQAAANGLGDGRSSVKTAARKLQRTLEKAGG